MSCVNKFAEFVDVMAATMEMPISHHGIERPVRKKSDDEDFLPILEITGIARSIAKNTATITQSITAKSIIPIPPASIV
jgi:hypothetical protein